jgi:predicted transcriptional regulator
VGALAPLKEIRARREGAELELRAARAEARPAIAAAREGGHTWQEIADTLGITRQAVHLLMKRER